MSNLVTAASDYVSYLEAQLEKADHERLLVVREIDSLKAQFSQMADLRSELAERNMSLAAAERELSLEKLLVQEEREKVARLMEENTVLQAQADDDRKKIASLIRMRRSEMTGGGAPFNAMGMHEPPQATAFARAKAAATPTGGCVPEACLPVRSTRKAFAAANDGPSAPTSMSLRSVVTDFAHSHPHAAAAQSAPGATAADEAAALQTPLGSTLVACLSREVETLKRLLDEQRRAYEHDRARRLHDERRRQDALIDKDRAQMAQLVVVEDSAQHAVKELCLYRHQQQIVERALRGEVEMLKVACIETQRTVTGIADRKNSDLQLALEMATGRSQDAVAKLRGELVERRGAHHAERERLQSAITELRLDHEKLSKELENERRARQRAEERLHLGREGERSEVALLKQHLRAIEKKLYYTNAKDEQRAASAAQLLASILHPQLQEAQ